MPTIPIYLVRLPIIAPIVARPGHLLAVWLDSPTQTIAVYEPAEPPRQLATADTPPALLQTMLAGWLRDGVIVPCASSWAPLAPLPVRAPRRTE